MLQLTVSETLKRAIKIRKTRAELSKNVFIFKGRNRGANIQN